MTSMSGSGNGVNRRSAVSALLALGLCGAAPARAAPAVYQDFWIAPRELWVYRKETGEVGRYEYWRDGQIQLEAWYEILHLLRDVVAGVAIHYDPRAIDIVWGVQEWIWRDSGRRHIFRLSDGARMESTNLMIKGASPVSEHLKGHATDGRFEGIDLNVYARAARSFRAGGVGLYKAHVHTDCGAIRTWGI